jgi:hypothetical protein
VTGTKLGRHGHIIFDPGGGRHQQTFLAIAGDDYLAILAPFEHGLAAIQPEIGFGFLRTVAAQA